MGYSISLFDRIKPLKVIQIIKYSLAARFVNESMSGWTEDESTVLIIEYSLLFFFKQRWKKRFELLICDNLLISLWNMMRN